MSTPPLAFSYIRFSTPEQAEGDSLRRQTAGAEAFCARHGLTLDTSLSLRDLGVSAFKGRHRTGDKHALAQFLKAAQEGRIPEGSYLVIENLDRLSREEERTALRLFMDILDHGINIVQLQPEVIFRHEKSDMIDLFRAIIEMSRAHGESARKSERLGEAWDAKRAAVAGGGKKLTGQGPFWLALSEDRTTFNVIEDRAAVVRRMFRMSREGHGQKAIAKALNADEVPSPQSKPGRVKAWQDGSVRNVLMSRAVIGEYTPHKVSGGERRPCGDPIPGYYPAILGEADFYAAQAAIQARRRQRGRRGKDIANVFAEMLRDARDGTPLHITRKNYGGRKLVSSGAIRGQKGCEYHAFSFAVFERAILSKLYEVKASEILGATEPDETEALSGQVTAKRERIARFEAMLAGDDIEAVGRQLKREQEELKELTARLADASRKAASPLSEAWGEAHSLIEAMDAAPDPDEARVRLRSAIRRIVETVVVLVVPHGRSRLCAVQMWFAGGGVCRSYIIAHRPRLNGGIPEAAGADSMVGAEKFDMRRPDHVKTLTAKLEAEDFEEILRGLPPVRS